MTKEELPSAVDDAPDVISGLTPEEKKRIEKEKEEERKKEREERLRKMREEDPFIYD